MRFPTTFKLASLCVFVIFFKKTDAQVFMQPLPNAAALGLATSNLTAPVSENSFANSASIADDAGSGISASSALPFGLGAWQTGNIQAWHGLNENTGIGFNFATSGIETYREQQMGLYFGKKLLRNFWLSSEFYWLSSVIPEYGTQNGFSFGLSALSAPTNNVRIAMRLFNPIRIKIGEIESPAILETGISYDFNEKAAVYGAFQKDLDRPLQLRFGLRYAAIDKLSLRFGFRSQPARPTFGLGFKIAKNLRIDTAAEWHTVLGITPALGIVWEKNQSKN